jgi:agmatinase
VHESRHDFYLLPNEASTGFLPFYDTPLRPTANHRSRDDNPATWPKANEISLFAEVVGIDDNTDCNRFNIVATRAIFFPFDLFGSAGAKAGAELLADAFQELLADNKRERIATRARAYANKVRFEEYAFETLADYQDWRSQARTRIRQVIQHNEFLLWVTGNHLGALPVYDELPNETLVVQLDAHLDIYNLSDCTMELSHGNFLLHAAKPLPAIVNLGHRELLLRPEYIHKYYQAAFSAAEITLDGAGVLAKLRGLCEPTTRVIVDLDCDVFDPAYFPATPQARPFGLDPLFCLRVLDAVGSERLAGLAISEFDPARDQHDRCLETLMWLIEYVFLMKYER